jgi:hypothetical protein
MHCGAEVTESSTNKQHHLSGRQLQQQRQRDAALDDADSDDEEGRAPSHSTP